MTPCPSRAQNCSSEPFLWDKLLCNTSLVPFLFPKSNEFLRNVFELGPPVMLDAATLKTMKISRFERVGVSLCFQPTYVPSACAVVWVTAFGWVGSGPSWPRLASGTDMGARRG